MSIERAKAFATKHHKGQVDKAGADYMSHVVQVYENVCHAGGSEDAKIAALLHDVVEDTAVEIDEIAREFGSRVAEIVKLVTKPKPFHEQSYFDAIKVDEDARIVKLADLSHNSDLSRITSPTEKDIARTKKYHRKIAFLKDEIEVIN
ncbi:HD domain-containing protein [Umboniibacter marinipuniceus]|uniref:HD domain-containing protein n=1 Tax=Umboniibacter marinipuniceus TaxID=569599 RepID=A0A3M0AUQ1_9GAMM|nr:HD domain-containing protein [Umboniibacter marinipuniceus]RMA82692.1 HD domain-containing protein [Umboniibacter marinipuniceus]